MKTKEVIIPKDRVVVTCEEGSYVDGEKHSGFKVAARLCSLFWTWMVVT